MKNVKPNLLLIMCDQLRADALGCTGGWVRTPHLDQLARQGILFSNCVTTSPVCIPARLSQATGLYAHNTGVWNNIGRDMSPETQTWMQQVRASGYRTSLFGKSHLHRHQGDLRDREHLMHAYGFDDINEIGGPRASIGVLSHMTQRWQEAGYWEKYREDYKDRFAKYPQIARPSPLPLELYADVYVGQTANAYLKNYTRSEPWCCWVSFGGPHEPWDAPDCYTQRYDKDRMPKPREMPEERGARPCGVFDATAKEHQERFKLTADEIAAMRQNYAGNVTLIDELIGVLIETIKARGEYENTLIVFTSDHGEMNGDCGMLYKSNFMNAAVRVPFIVKPPGSDVDAQRNAGSVCTAPLEWIDSGATLLDYAGGSYKQRQFAQSVRPLLQNPETRLREWALSEFENEFMLLDEKWKLALNAAGKTYLLFDLQNDPDERVNLAGDPAYQTQADRLRLKILERLCTTQLVNSHA